MSSRYRINFAVSLFLFAVRFSFCFESFSFSLEVFLFAAPWGYSFLPCVFFFLPWGYSICHFKVDSSNSNFHFFPRCYGGHSASRSSRKTRRLGMRLNRVLVLRREQWTNNSYRMLCFESFVFTCLTYRNVQRFRNGPVHEFYRLKASQMSKVRASSHEYPHMEKSRIFGNRI